MEANSQQQHSNFFKVQRIQERQHNFVELYQVCPNNIQMQNFVKKWIFYEHYSIV